MQSDPSKKVHSIPLKHYGWILIGVWTLVAVASLGWNLLQDREEALRVARHIALTNYERDVLYRRWAAAHGGVYVPVTPIPPPPLTWPSCRNGTSSRPRAAGSPCSTRPT